MLASVAMAGGNTQPPPLLLIDNHLPYPAAILQVFGVIRHRRRKRGRGRLKHPDLKPPPGLLAGVVDCVAVCKVDRVSRSRLESARMMETFEKDNFSFASVTQHFNTPASMGRLSQNILLSFA